jgi:hypothetical protein
MDALAPIPDATLTLGKQLVLARMAGELGKRFRAVAVSNTHPWHRSSPQPKPVEPQDARHMCKPHLHVLASQPLATGLTDDNPRKGNVSLALAAVLGITLLDAACAAAQQRQQTTRAQDDHTRVRATQRFSRCTEGMRRAARDFKVLAHAGVVAALGHGSIARCDLKKSAYAGEQRITTESSFLGVRRMQRNGAVALATSFARLLTDAIEQALGISEQH